MPSSLIIVALAAAWLVVLVPMVARRRQEVARPADSALSARVVRSGTARDERWEEFAMSENASQSHARTADEPFVDVGERQHQAEVDEYDDAYADDYADEYADDYVDDYAEEEAAEAEPYDERAARADRPEPEHGGARRARPYRPGRGGFDPEAAEIAARAKYAYRQRVVVGLLAAAVVTALVAAVVLPVVWWLHAIVDVTLVGYLVYLRRQVRIENEIRERRTARMGRTAGTQVRGASELPRRAENYDEEAFDDYEQAYAEDEYVEPAPRPTPRPQPRPMPEPIQHNGVYVDLDDEDPAFHDLDQPDEPPFRKAVGQ